ncbi:carbohydrate esterase family 4 protein [Mycena crocata]|nr:carbohydrate esterase family 4 protein [Mycena crocata]
MLATALLAAFVGLGSALTFQGRDGLANVYDSCVTPGTAAFSFDDGPYIYSKDISKMFTDAGGHCTFFVNGDNWDCIYDSRQQDSLKFAYASGHQIASHTWSHKDLTKCDNATMQSEINQVDVALQRILGITPAFMRPPYGAFNDDVRAAAAANGKELVIWDFDSGDSTDPPTNATKIKQDYDAAKTRTGKILALNHETSNTTVSEVMPSVIQVYLDYGYKLVTVAECLGNKPAYSATTEAGKPNYQWHC